MALPAALRGMATSNSCGAFARHTLAICEARPNSARSPALTYGDSRPLSVSCAAASSAAGAAALARSAGGRGQERGGPRPRALIKQPGARHRGEQIVAVDHLVVEYRRRGAGAIAFQVIQHRALADVLLVRNLTLH